jgi:hypothetical protein
MTNVFVNYTIKNSSRLRGSKIQLAINNLANHHSLVGVTPGFHRPPRCLTCKARTIS